MEQLCGVNSASEYTIIRAKVLVWALLAASLSARAPLRAERVTTYGGEKKMGMEEKTRVEILAV